MNRWLLIVFAALAGCGGGDSGTGEVNSPVQSPPVATSSATVEWEPVAAGDLAGYKLYQSTSSGSQGSIVSGNISPSSTRYTVGNLQVGATYYFVVTAYDTSGNESTPSNQITRTIK
ncbi:hypothetical protein W02_18480 [Nitrospira sp. KM1]|uniref:fibronectin type III domain-containing protein n=1 Tax=Nitrospira sp. KM1 TaxID=1936990 RepID=UPI0013A753DE|nr:fibronectin type III domain-containing protein [Nitrospira sp. KM1]BCA54708.1 hypothetical protein W02_18480 [Nitrospira sp. KM1]